MKVQRFESLPYLTKRILADGIFKTNIFNRSDHSTTIRRRVIMEIITTAFHLRQPSRRGQ